MTQVRIGDIGGEIDAISAAGVVVPHEGALGCTLVAGTTYYFETGDKDSIQKSIHLVWDAAVIVTFTLWGSDLPRNLQDMGGGGIDTSGFSQAKGAWLQIANALLPIYITSDDGTVGGATVTLASSQVVVAGTGAGGALYEMINAASKRYRIRAVVGATGGKVRCVTGGKE